MSVSVHSKNFLIKLDLQTKFHKLSLHKEYCRVSGCFREVFGLL